MASHRKPRTRTLQTLHAHSPAVGVTTAAALASVTLLSSQSAAAAPGGPGDADRGPTVEEVQRKVDDLYRQAGTATQRYGRAGEVTDRERRATGGVLDGAARRTEAPAEPRRAFSGHAAAPYRSGGPGPATSPLFPEPDTTRAFVDRTEPMDPVKPVDLVKQVDRAEPVDLVKQVDRTRTIGPAEPVERTQPMDRVTDLGDRTQPMDRVTGLWHETLTDHPAVQTLADHPPVQSLAGHPSVRAGAADQPVEAAAGPESPSEPPGASQASLRASKQTVQRKLAEARALLARLTAEERARAARERETCPPHEEHPGWHPEYQVGWHPEDLHARERPWELRPEGDAGHTAKAARVLAFAEAQTGKPYVWGATGPSSYDCSGLTQAAWRAAGVDLPRTIRDQAAAGTPVALEDLRPGDLVFFHDDISHVGIYKGDGKMIHAPMPGANVREEAISSMPVHSSVRPA
ncbi:C40 family peptidase [Streptomyces sp. NPDC047821]|uniref:C40 family peptidase n=1 Tax=Streptomyces sp. NPDC047821 TaxID=3365488 RepID=UPI00371328CE